MADQLEPGQWYFAVDCKSCNRQFPFMTDKSEGKINFISPGKLLLTCPQCAQQKFYDTDEVQHYQHL